MRRAEKRKLIAVTVSDFRAYIPAMDSSLKAGEYCSDPYLKIAYKHHDDHTHHSHDHFHLFDHERKVVLLETKPKIKVPCPAEIVFTNVRRFQ